MLRMAYDITNKVVFITGAWWGIGKGSTQVLAAASASDYMTGQTLFLDGGLSL